MARPCVIIFVFFVATSMLASERPHPDATCRVAPSGDAASRSLRRWIICMSREC